MHTDRKRIVGYTHEETLDAIYRAVKSRHAEISLTERDRLCGIYMFEVRKEIKKEVRREKGTSCESLYQEKCKRPRQHTV